MNETTETRRIVKDIKLYDPDAFVYKVHGTPMGKRGVPDLYVLTKGMHWWLEIKVHPNKPTALQEQTMLDIAIAGGVIGILTIREVEPGKIWTMVGDVNIEGRDSYQYLFQRLRGEHWEFRWLDIVAFDFKVQAAGFEEAIRQRPQQ